MKQYSNETKAPVLAAKPQDRPRRCPLVTWWRLKPATAFDATALVMMQDSLSKIDMLGEPRWKNARRVTHRRRSALHSACDRPSRTICDTISP